MKRVIYTPVVDEAVPDGAMFYTFEIAGDVIDAIVSDDFITDGTILYDSTPTESGVLVELSEYPVHNFAGWNI